MSFQNELEKSFGRVDQVFGGHPIESEHARKMLKETSAQGLTTKGCSSHHIDEQIKRMNDIDNYI